MTSTTTTLDFVWEQTGPTHLACLFDGRLIGNVYQVANAWLAVVYNRHPDTPTGTFESVASAQRYIELAHFHRLLISLP